MRGDADLKVLHVLNDISAKAGGTTYALRNILLTERQAGICSEVATLRAEDNALDLFSFTRAHAFPPSFPRRFGRSASANRWLDARIGQYDFVCVHGAWCALYLEAARIATRHDAPYFVFPHGSLDPFDLQKKRYAKRALGPTLVREMLRGSRAVVCATRQEAERVETYGASPLRLT